MNIKEMVVAVVMSSLYAALVVILGIFSYGPLQLRIADALIMLSALIGWPAIVGATLGCFIGNIMTNILYYWIGPLDIFLGPLANFLSSVLIFYMRKKPYVAGILGSLIVGIIVGSYLWLFFPPPSSLTIFHPWTAMVVSITSSSIVTIVILGNLLLKVLRRPPIISLFKSIGIKIYLNEV